MYSRHILLTGLPGIGKTTVIQKTCDLLKEKSITFQGLITEEVRHGRERVGFDIVTSCGKHGELARKSDSVTGELKVGKYAVNVSSFEAIALPVFDNLSASVFILDEIGKMEAFSKPFLERTKAAFSKGDIKILATIPLAGSRIPLVNELRNRKDCLIIEVTRENRSCLPNEIIELLTQVVAHNYV